MRTRIFKEDEKPKLGSMGGQAHEQDLVAPDNQRQAVIAGIAYYVVNLS